MRVPSCSPSGAGEGPAGRAGCVLIAKHIRSNVRELEGALKRVMAYASFHGHDISLALTKEALKDLLAVQNRQISIDNIQKTSPTTTRIRITDMHSKKRSRAVARPRQIAMALAKELTTVAARDRQQLRGPRPHHGPARLPDHRGTARGAFGDQPRRHFPAAGAAELGPLRTMPPAQVAASAEPAAEAWRKPRFA